MSKYSIKTIITIVTIVILTIAIIIKLELKSLLPKNRKIYLYLSIISISCGEQESEWIMPYN